MKKPIHFLNFVGYLFLFFLFSPNVFLRADNDEYESYDGYYSEGL